MKNKMSKKNRFKSTWSNQTNIAKKFGLSGVALGKILKERGLKGDDNLATSKAIEGGYALEANMKDGTKFFMWNIHKTNSLLCNFNYQKVSKVDYYVKEIEKLMEKGKRQQKKGNDKIAIAIYDFLYDEIPEEYKQPVKQIIDKKYLQGEYNEHN
jgi:hypothetical protein